jgi:hypothetical protein
MKYYRLDFFSFITHAGSDLELRLHFAGVGRVYTHKRHSVSSLRLSARFLRSRYSEACI